jgi:hypothetical protein
MDDATMDRIPDSVIQISMEWNADGTVAKEEARSLNTLTPIWAKYLVYVYEQFVFAAEGVDS